MNIDQAAGILWDSMQEGIYYPEPLRGKLTVETTYPVQLSVLEKCLASGQKHGGWKIGLTSAALRAQLQVPSPIYGYLLEDNHYPSGQVVQFEDISSPALEPEICFTLNKRLQGPGVTRKEVVDAIGSIAPAFEVVSMRGNPTADAPLGIADNILQWGYVTGAEVRPYPENIVLSEVVCEVTKNQSLVAQVRAEEVIDNQLESIANLANHLANYGLALEAGQSVMTGSFTQALPVAKGECWEVRFSSLGSATVSF